MQKQVELRAEMVRQGKRYRDLARELREHGIGAETDDVLAVVNGKRRADDAFKKAVADVLGRPTFELFR